MSAAVRFDESAFVCRQLQGRVLRKHLERRRFKVDGVTERTGIERSTVPFRSFTTDTS